jgi:hypothetical protein
VLSKAGKQQEVRKHNRKEQEHRVNADEIKEESNKKQTAGAKDSTLKRD